MCDTFDYRCGEFQLGSKQMTNVFAHHGRGRMGLGPDKADWLMPEGLALSQDVSARIRDRQRHDGLGVPGSLASPTQ